MLFKIGLTDLSLRFKIAQYLTKCTVIPAMGLSGNPVCESVDPMKKPIQINPLDTR